MEKISFEQAPAVYKTFGAFLTMASPFFKNKSEDEKLLWRVAPIAWITHNYEEGSKGWVEHKDSIIRIANNIDYSDAFEMVRSMSNEFRVAMSGTMLSMLQLESPDDTEKEYNEKVEIYKKFAQVCNFPQADTLFEKKRSVEKSSSLPKKSKDTSKKADDDTEEAEKKEKVVYVFKGVDYKKKTDLVQAVVHDYIDTHNITTIEELKQVFDVRVKKGILMVLSLEDAMKTTNSAGEAGGNFAISEEMQIPLKKKGFLGIKTGVKVVVWKYWPERFFDSFLELAQRIGCKIEVK